MPKPNVNQGDTTLKVQRTEMSHQTLMIRALIVGEMAAFTSNRFHPKPKEAYNYNPTKTKPKAGTRFQRKSSRGGRWRFSNGRAWPSNWLRGSFNHFLPSHDISSYSGGVQLQNSHLFKLLESALWPSFLHQPACLLYWLMCVSQNLGLWNPWTNKPVAHSSALPYLRPRHPGNALPAEGCRPP